MPFPGFDPNSFQNNAFQTGGAGTVFTFTADAVLRKAFTANAILRKGFTANAVLRKTAIVHSFTADALTRTVGVTLSFTANAVLRLLTVPKSFTANAILASVSGRKISAFYADCVLTNPPQAQRLNIWRTGANAYTNYSQWVYDGNNELFILTWPLNGPKTLTFTLEDGDTGFIAPDMGNRVQLISLLYGVWFTGYLTSVPQRVLLGALNGVPVYGYNCSATSEEMRLEWQTSAVFSTLLPFVNKTQGQIIKGMIAALGGGFDTSNVQDGILIPFFRVKPTESFGDSYRRLLLNTNMKFWTSNGAAYLAPYNDLSFGYSPDELDISTRLDPTQLAIQPITNPVYNDVIGIGSEEPQVYATEYFLGDGFTATFPLALPLFGSTLSKLLDCDWTQSVIDATLWFPTDLNHYFVPQGGALLFFAPRNAPSASRLTALQGLEIAGSLVLDAGRIRVLGPTDCIIGGVFAADTGNLADCIAGFRATPTATQCTLQPIVSGVPVGPTFTTLAGATYAVTLGIDTSVLQRRERPYFSLLNQFGGADVPANADISFTVWALSDQVDSNGIPLPPTLVISYTATINNIQGFAFYTLLAGPVVLSNGVNIQINLTSLHKAIYAEVWSKPDGTTQWVRQTLGDANDPSARCSIVASTDSGDQLGFFNNVAPAVRERIKIAYRSAGIIRARVQDPASIAAEAAKAGDAGIRSQNLPTLNPAPFSAVDYERAIQAYIDDYTIPVFQGTWTFDSKSYLPPSPGFAPIPGRFMAVNCPSMYPPFSSLVQQVESHYLLTTAQTGEEIIQHVVTFAPMSLFAIEQVTYQPPDEALEGQLDQITNIVPIPFNSVGLNFSNDRPDVEFDEVFTATIYEIDAGVPPDSTYEVRQSNYLFGSGSTLNQLLAPVSTEKFSVLRNSNNVVVFIKNVDSSGRLSRYASMVRINWPITPNQPTAVVSDDSNLKNPVITIGQSVLDDVNVYGVEIRDTDNATVLYQAESIALTTNDLVWIKANNDALAIDLWIYTFNLLNEYSPGYNLVFTLSGAGLLGEVTGDNFVGNPGFEISTVTYPAGLQGSVAGVPISDGWIAQVTSDLSFGMMAENAGHSHGGQWNLLSRLQAGKSIAGGSTTFSQGNQPTKFAVRVGDFLYFGGWARWDESNVSLPAGVIGSVLFVLQFFDSAGNFVENVNSLVLYSPSSWIYLDGAAEVPTGAATATLLCQAVIQNGSGSAFNTGANGYMDARFDDVFVYKADRGVNASYRPLSNPISSIDSGNGFAEIDIAAFTMRAGASSVALDSGVVAMLPFNTLYFVYYDDPSFAGGAVSFNATTVKETAIFGENRFFVGSIQTPRQGATPTTGNNDGGSGAQNGMLNILSFSTISYDFRLGTGTSVNPANFLDGDPTTFGSLVAGGTGIGNTNNITVRFSLSPGIQARFFSLALKVLWGVPTNTLDGNYPAVNFVANGVGHRNGNFASVNAGQTQAITVTSIPIDPTLNLSQVFLTVEVFANNSVGGTCQVDIYDVWIEAIE